MSNSADHEPVRPLDSAHNDRRDHHPPRLGIVVALLGIGGLLGWVGASLGTEPAPTAPDLADEQITETTPPAPADPPAAIVEWTAATLVPDLPTGREYDGISGVAEFNGYVYVAVNFRDPVSGESSAQLWRSPDGLEWEGEPIDRTNATYVYELVSTPDALLLTARIGDSYGVWRSNPDGAVDGSSWSRIQLAIPDHVGGRVSRLGVAVNRDGGIMVTLNASLEVWPEIITPFLPDGIDLDDPNIEYFGNQYAVNIATGGTIPLFAEVPEVVVAEDSVWIRLVPLDGEEIFHAVPLPAGTYPAETTATLEHIPLTMAWISDDGIEFLPVIGRNALPDGYFLPEPWADGFIAAVYKRADSFAVHEQVTLWESGSGRAWQPADMQPPRECSPYFFAVSDDRMHLTTEDGTQCVREGEANWEILDEASTVSYVAGGPAGFVGYPNSFEYDTAIYSGDGTDWSEIRLPVSEPYPTLSILDDRLLALSANRRRPDAPTRIEIWLGEISG